MTWTVQQIRNSRAKYDRLYSTGHAKQQSYEQVHVPENVERRDVHSPCFRCESRGGCRHRPWA